MHCPDNISGYEYVELVAAAAIILSKDLNAWNTFLLAEFLNDVSRQLFVLGGFKEFQEKKNKK
jgi:hypothetical protein